MWWNGPDDEVYFFFGQAEKLLSFIQGFMGSLTCVTHNVCVCEWNDDDAKKERKIVSPSVHIYLRDIELAIHDSMLSRIYCCCV